MNRRIQIITFLLFLFTFLVACSEEKREVSEVTPGAVITVETGSAEVGDKVMISVQNMLVQNPVFAAKMLSHGLGSATTYRFKFRGSCATEDELRKAVADEIRKTVVNVVSCIDVR